MNPSNANIDLSSPEKDSEFERVFEGLQRANPKGAEPEPGHGAYAPHIFSSYDVLYLITSGNLVLLRRVGWDCKPGRDERICTFPGYSRELVVPSERLKELLSE